MRDRELSYSLHDAGVEIVDQLGQLGQTNRILPPTITQENLLAVTPGFRARVVLMPGFADKSVRVERSLEPGACIFCPPHGDEIAFDWTSLGIRGGYRLIANNLPYFRHQVMLNPTMHREFPTEDDFSTAADFQRQTGFAGVLNLRGSGASIPDHLHFQFGQFGEVDLPILGLQKGLNSELLDGTTVGVLDDYPGLVLVIEEFPVEELARKAYLLSQGVLQKGMSFNLIFDRGRILLIPRTHSESESLPNWHIGSACLGGLFVPDGRQTGERDPDAILAVMQSRFEHMNSQRYARAIADVTLPKDTSLTEFLESLQFSPKAA